VVSALAGHYEKVGNEFEIKGRMKLALLTAIPSGSASSQDDTPENIQKFEQAIAQIRKTGIS
jgi:hypothetical protein